MDVIQAIGGGGGSWRGRSSSWCAITVDDDGSGGDGDGVVASDCRRCSHRWLSWRYRFLFLCYPQGGGEGRNKHVTKSAPINDHLINLSVYYLFLSLD